MAPLRLRIQGHRFLDNNDREVILHGINVAADMKYPAEPQQPSHVSDNFFDGDKVSFVNHPFSLQDAPSHFSRLRKWGFNTIRYIFTWEAIEHEGPGKYDDEFCHHTVSILRMAKEYGFYVFMDPHQDVWSRFTGGSGAPMWTLYACGLNPEKFLVTEAALVQNVWPEPENFPKMIWATNYYRLACQVMFTMFWAGRDFVPRAIIDGKNIQDYLQDHHIDACKHLAKRIHEAGDLEDGTIIGWESFNEPNRGIIGHQDITAVPAEQKLQKGTSPNAWQAMLLGSGRSCEVETWEVGGTGPYKTGTTLVDPQGEVAWLPADYDDSRYGWKRDPEWKLGQCIWAQHDIWDPQTDTLFKKDYFARDPRNGKTIDYLYFTNNWFMDFYIRYQEAIRGIHGDSMLLCQPPTLEFPPNVKGTARADPNSVYCPHWYDGLTLMTKKWNRWFNVDVFGILRGRYLHPALGVKLGETAIRNCFRDQLGAMRQEGTDYMGNIPCVFTETGIPYDMNDKLAYTTGDYSSQIAAMDAIHFALEGAKIQGYTLWTYVASNNHEWGDNWNGEDLSIFSLDDRQLPPSTSSLTGSTASLDPMSPSYSRSMSSDTSTETPSTVKKAFSSEQMSVSESASKEPDKLGYRAAEAFVRPWPNAVHGSVTSFGFDLKNCTFTLTLNAASATSESAPTEVFLPEWHFPATSTAVDVSGGKWAIGVESEVQKLKWWHAEGDQTITVKGLVRKLGTPMTNDGDEGYLEQCQRQAWNLNCTLM